MNWLSVQVQAIGGVFLLLLLLWQLATGMRWIKFGRRTVKVHRWAGIALVVLSVGHGILGLMIAGLISL